MPRHFKGLDRRDQFRGAVAPSSLLEHCQRLTGIEIEICGVVPDNATLVNERREDGKILFLERGEMMPIDARRLLGFPEGDALGNPGLPQRVPEDAHRDNPAPLSPAHECPRTLDPQYPSYRIRDVWTTRKGLTRSSSRNVQGSCGDPRYVRSGGAEGLPFPSSDRKGGLPFREKRRQPQRAKHHR